jgi:hypothetical protein
MSIASFFRWAVREEAAGRLRSSKRAVVVEPLTWSDRQRTLSVIHMRIHPSLVGRFLVGRFQGCLFLGLQPHDAEAVTGIPWSRATRNNGILRLVTDSLSGLGRTVRLHGPDGIGQHDAIAELSRFGIVLDIPVLKRLWDFYEIDLAGTLEIRGFTLKPNGSDVATMDTEPRIVLPLTPDNMPSLTR